MPAAKRPVQTTASRIRTLRRLRQFTPRRPRGTGEQRPQETAGVRALDGGDLLGRADGDDLAPGLATFRPEVDEVIGLLDHVEIVLDHEHGVAAVDEPLQHLEQLLDIGEVQSGRRLVEDVERLARCDLATTRRRA